jgi:hypothetical protein
MPKPTNYDELYPGRFLKAGLLKGQKVTLTIKDVDLEQMEDNTGKPKQKAIISFSERPLELVACKTNGLCLKAMFGKDLGNWIGKRVTLFPGQWNGEECIRIWGSPDIERQFEVSIELPRRRPFPMLMHKVDDKKQPVAVDNVTVDPRVEAAWGILGLSRAEGLAELAMQGGDQQAYLSDLNFRIDRQEVAS